MKLGFIGLGDIGMPMAKTLLAAGFDLTVYNRSRGKLPLFTDPTVRQVLSKELRGLENLSEDERALF